jgi:hypothetical protein
MWVMPLNVKTPVAIINIILSNTTKLQLAQKCISSSIAFYEYIMIISINRYNGLVVVIDYNHVLCEMHSKIEYIF